MPGPYSQDLRDRVASAIAGGSSACAAARRFRISESTAVRWAQRLNAEGHAEARAMGGDRRSRLTGHRATVLTLIAHQPVRWTPALRQVAMGTVKRLGVRCWAGYDRPSV